MIIRWLIVNSVTILLIVIWSQIQGYDSNYILLGKIVAQAAFILYLINLNMYFVFLLIRKSKIRAVKIKLAKISKKMMKYHVSIAITATILVFGHAGIMLYAHFGKLWIPKTISGTVLIGILGFLLFSGMLRRWKSTGNRRKFHYSMAFIFFGFVFLHVFI